MTDLDRVEPPLSVVLHHPEIPQNTGNVARLCACTGARLHLVAPLGFEVTDSRLKRAGLDYWDKVHAATWHSFEELLAANQEARLHLFHPRAPRSMWEARFSPGDFLVFGSESVGLPPQMLEAHRDRVVAIPMVPERRSLNVASCVAAALYHALYQLAAPRV